MTLRTYSNRQVGRAICHGQNACALCCALLLLAGLATLARAADPQSYRVNFASTGIKDVDSTVKATSQLATLRTSAPVDPFGLIARARSDVERVTTVLESFGYYQSSTSIPSMDLPSMTRSSVTL